MAQIEGAAQDARLQGHSHRVSAFGDFPDLSEYEQLQRYADNQFQLAQRKIMHVEGKVDTLTTAVGELTVKVTGIETTMNTKFAEMDTKFTTEFDKVKKELNDKMDDEFKTMNDKFKTINDKVDNNFKTLNDKVDNKFTRLQDMITQLHETVALLAANAGIPVPPPPPPPPPPSDDGSQVSGPIVIARPPRSVSTIEHDYGTVIAQTAAQDISTVKAEVAVVESDFKDWQEKQAAAQSSAAKVETGFKSLKKSFSRIFPGKKPSVPDLKTMPKASKKKIVPKGDRKEEGTAGTSKAS